MENEKKLVACYCRVSTVHQVDKESIPSQKNMLQKYADAYFSNISIKFYIDAGYSGKNDKRPQYTAMMNDIKDNKVLAVLTFKIDRVSRNLNDFLRFLDTLKKHDVKFISLSENFDTTSIINQSMLKMLALFGELERNMTSERVMSISKDIVSRGGHLGQPTPFGYDYDKETKVYSINEEQSKWIRWMFNEAANGKTTTYISNYLNDNGVKTKRNGKWSSTTVNNILHNLAYTGTYSWNKYTSGRKKKKDISEYITNRDFYPVIISEELFDAVQKSIKSRMRNQNTIKSKQSHLFSGILSCVNCGRKLQYRRDKVRNDGSIVSLYFCAGYTMHWGCTNDKYLSDVKVAPFILQFLSNYIKLDMLRTAITTRQQLTDILCKHLNKSLDNIDYIYQCYAYNHDENTSKYEADYREMLNANNTLSDELAKQNIALDRLRDLYLYSDSAMSRTEYSEQRKKILDKIAALKEDAMHKTNLLSTKLNVDYKKYADIIDYLKNTDKVSYKYMRTHYDHDKLCLFMHDVFKEIIVYKRDILRVTLANDMLFNFK